MGDHERCDVCGASNGPTERYVDAKGDPRVACADEHACADRHHRLTPDERRKVSEYRFDRIGWANHDHA
jgi:hypothetical protein